MEKNQKLLMIGATALLVAGYGIYSYVTKGKGGQQQAQEEETKGGDTACQASSGGVNFVDPGFDTNHYLTKIEAANRSSFVSDVDYTLIMGLVKGG